MFNKKVLKEFSKAVVTIGLGLVLLTGCGTNKNPEVASAVKSNEKLKIGIVQLADHQALVESKKGFEDGIKELGIDADIEVKSAQGEIAVTNTIASDFVGAKKDLIYAIATPSAQAVKNATKDIPVVFSAVTDAVGAKLVDSNEAPGGNITGTIDKAPMEKQIKMFKELNPEAKTIGIIYNTSEENSLVQVKEAKEIAEKLNLEIEEIGLNTINDVSQAMDSFIGKIQGLYTITDNMIASSITVITDKANSANIPTIGAEIAHVEGGALMSDSISYYELGKQAAKMAERILVEKENPAEISVESAKETKKVLNSETLEKIGLDKNLEIFKDAEIIK